MSVPVLPDDAAFRAHLERQGLPAHTIKAMEAKRQRTGGDWGAEPRPGVVKDGELYVGGLRIGGGFGQVRDGPVTVLSDAGEVIGIAEVDTLEVCAASVATGRSSHAPAVAKTLHVFEDADGLLLDGKPATFREGKGAARRLTRDRAWGEALANHAQREGATTVSASGVRNASAMLRRFGIKATRNADGTMGLAPLAGGPLSVVWGMLAAKS